MAGQRAHSMPFGAEVLQEGGVCFRLWAPGVRQVDLCINDNILPMDFLGDGWFQLIVYEAGPGTLYMYSIEDELKVPDPASRYQPADVHGPSEVVAPLSFEWEDVGWKGRSWEETVLYELHVGAFSPLGTFKGVCSCLDYLVDLGVTAIELMPVADFPGKRNWGYDGVLLFAPDSCYGRPEDLKVLVQTAHQKGLTVFLDVVYNYFGPEGNYLHAYARDAFFTGRHRTPWGDAINFDGENSRTVRDFFVHNALYWLEEYHIDGLRLDAVHAIRDDSRPDILEELAEVVRQGLGGTGRCICCLKTTITPPGISGGTQRASRGGTRPSGMTTYTTPFTACLRESRKAITAIMPITLLYIWAVVWPRALPTRVSRPVIETGPAAASPAGGFLPRLLSLSCKTMTRWETGLSGSASPIWPGNRP